MGAVEDEIERIRDKQHEMANSLTKLEGGAGRLDERLDGHVMLCVDRDKNTDRRMTRLEATIGRLMFTSLTASVSALAVVIWQIISIKHGG